MRRELVRGDLPALVLVVLSRQPLHGYGIALAVKQLSDNALTMKEAALYPALRVLEQDGYIVGTWEKQDAGAARKIYKLTETGTKEARRRTQELRDYMALINGLLEKLYADGTGRKGIGHAQPV